MILRNGAIQNIFYYEKKKRQLKILKDIRKHYTPVNKLSELFISGLRTLLNAFWRHIILFQFITNLYLVASKQQITTSICRCCGWTSWLNFCTCMKASKINAAAQPEIIACAKVTELITLYPDLRLLVQWVPPSIEVRLQAVLTIFSSSLQLK